MNFDEVDDLDTCRTSVFLRGYTPPHGSPKHTSIVKALDRMGFWEYFKSDLFCMGRVFSGGQARMAPRGFGLWRSAVRLLGIPLIVVGALGISVALQVPQGEMASSARYAGRHATGQA